MIVPLSPTLGTMNPATDPTMTMRAGSFNALLKLTVELSCIACEINLYDNMEGEKA